MADTDGWNGPRRHDEAGLGRLMNEIATLKRQVAELQRGAPLRAAGIGMSPEGLTVHSSLNVDGSLAATGDTTIGGTLDVGAATTISGDLEVDGAMTVTNQEGIRYQDATGRLRLVQGTQTQPGGVERTNVTYYDKSGTGRIGIGELVTNGQVSGEGIVVVDAAGGNALSVKGTGIDAPAFTIHCGPDDFSVWPGTNQSSWTTIYEGATRVYSPKVRVVGKATTTDSGTTGDVRILLRYNDVDYVLDSLSGVGFGYFFPSFDGARPAAIPLEGYVYLRMQARRTAGTGSVRGTILQAVLLS